MIVLEFLIRLNIFIFQYWYQVLLLLSTFLCLLQCDVSIYYHELLLLLLLFKQILVWSGTSVVCRDYELLSQAVQVNQHHNKAAHNKIVLAKIAYGKTVY